MTLRALTAILVHGLATKMRLKSLNQQRQVFNPDRGVPESSILLPIAAALVSNIGSFSLTPTGAACSVGEAIWTQAEEERRG